MSKKRVPNRNEQLTELNMDHNAMSRRQFLSKMGKLIAVGFLGRFAMIGNAMPGDKAAGLCFFVDSCTPSRDTDYSCKLLNKNYCSGEHTCDTSHTNYCSHESNFTCYNKFTCTSDAVNKCDADVTWEGLGIEF